MVVKKDKPNAVSVEARRKMLNKLAGSSISFNLKEENPTDVTYWISTGSTWLDAIIARGQMAGIPGGKITEIAGLQSVGKSYIALQIAVCAQRDLGMTVVYADPESGMNSEFMEKAGCDLEKLIYVQPPDLETWYEIMEEMLKSCVEGEKMLFILDSLASIPCRADLEGDYSPTSSISLKARVQSKALMKLNMPIANADATYIILNQLRANITELGKVPNPKFATDSQRYIAPGGKAAEFHASLRIWLTGSVSKKLKVIDEQGFRIGSFVKARLEKSRFGSQDRTCEFKILWGDEVGVMNEESILEAIKPAKEIVLGQWCSLKYGKKEWKWQKSEPGFVKLMREDAEFHQAAMEILNRDIVLAFKNKTGNAEDFYDLTPEQQQAADKKKKDDDIALMLKENK